MNVLPLYIMIIIYATMLMLTGFCDILSLITLLKVLMFQMNNIQLNLQMMDKDVGIIPYWNNSCVKLQELFWLPNQHSNVIHYNNVQYNNASSSIMNYSLLSTQLNPKQELQIKTTKKIRFYPKNPKHFWDIINTTRRAYNLCIEKFTNTPISEKIDPNTMRREIRGRVREEAVASSQYYAATSIDEAIRDAQNTKSAIISKRTKGLPCGFNYKSRKNAVQSYYIHYFSPNALAKLVHLTEEVPPESHKKMARVVHEHGRWYVCVQKLVDIKSFNFENQELKVCAVDPGVRCFATCYSTEKLNEIGQGFCVNKLVPIALKIRRLFGLRQKLLNTKKIDCVWYQQRLHGLNKSLDKLRAKRKDLINELHKYCAYFLVQNYDVILIPKFETSNMVRKDGRRISRGVVSRMLDLSHYKFQCRLRWMAKKYGKLVVAVNESYTSKTRSWDGVVIDNLRGADTISDGNIVVNRDHNGARGILLRALTR